MSIGGHRNGGRESRVALSRRGAVVSARARPFLRDACGWFRGCARGEKVWFVGRLSVEIENGGDCGSWTEGGAIERKRVRTTRADRRARARRRHRLAADSLSSRIVPPHARTKQHHIITLHFKTHSSSLGKKPERDGQEHGRTAGTPKGAPGSPAVPLPLALAQQARRRVQQQPPPRRGAPPPQQQQPPPPLVLLAPPPPPPPLALPLALPRRRRRARPRGQGLPRQAAAISAQTVNKAPPPARPGD